MSDYRITKEQQAYLDSLVCQRISDDEANKEIIQTFMNWKNPYLPDALKNGWGDDKKDKVAYYLIKDPADNQPLLFFSLRCGKLDAPFDREKLRQTLENSLALVDAACGFDAPDWAKEVIEKRKVNGILPRKKRDEFRKRYEKNLDKWNLYMQEIRLEGENIVRTKKSFAGVELVHFCVHEPAKWKWEKRGMSAQSLGKAMFWQFVEPIVCSIRSLVGCEYLYLFAADKRKYGRLVHYYQGLGFEIRDDLTVSKPEYDFCCYFMCQKVTSLRNRRNAFFREYNAPKVK